jgi:hypothetical protein
VWDTDGQSPLIRLIPGAEAYAFRCRAVKSSPPDFADSVRSDAKSLEPLGPPLTPGPGQGRPAATTFAASYYDGSQMVVNRSGLSSCTRCRLALRSVIPSTWTWRAPTPCSVRHATIAVGGQR